MMMMMMMMNQHPQPHTMHPIPIYSGQRGIGGNSVQREMYNMKFKNKWQR
jgi:hypothetical protein